jgi:hypothetical protein
MIRYTDDNRQAMTISYTLAISFHGERSLLRIPADWLLRMRYNPFYACLGS